MGSRLKRNSPSCAIIPKTRLCGSTDHFLRRSRVGVILKTQMMTTQDDSVGRIMEGGLAVAEISRKKWQLFVRTYHQKTSGPREGSQGEFAECVTKQSATKKT